ncbi:MAG: FAD binding domain-containing protein [Spirochaetota bacterium]
MKDIIYKRPESLQQAFELLQQYGSAARLFHGGTDLLVRQQKDMLAADVLIDTKRIEDISNEITVTNEQIRIGSRVVMMDITSHPVMVEHFPALVAAASTVGSIQIRNRATLTGNICNASPAADTVPALIVYGAVVHIANASGSRTVELRNFFLGPGKTVCAPDDIVTAIELPLPRRPFSAAFRRLTRRKGVDLATVNAACSINADGVTMFSLGAAGPTPVVVTESDPRLIDPSTPEQTRKDLLKALTDQGNPISDVRSGEAYRRAMLFHICWEALESAITDYHRQQTEGEN